MRAIWFGLVVLGCGDNSLTEPIAEPLADATTEAREPTYFTDVAPIVAARCAGCHRDGGVAPFTLTSYDDAASRSAQIAAATTERVMPPWPADASGACGTFVDSRWLPDDDIATLAAWHAAGAPEGEIPDIQRVPIPRAPTRFTPAVELGSDTPYAVRPGPDEYRCFVVDPGLATDRFITAIAMQLDRADVVHHMQLFAADSAVAEQAIADRDALDPAPGYACGEEGVGSLRYVGVWAPGDVVRRWPDGTGIRLAAGRRLVLQLHYHNHGSDLVADQTRVALELADTVDRVGWIESAAGFPLYLPPSQPDVTISSDVPFAQVPTGTIRGARIHMHGLGIRGRLELVRDGQATCLLDIPRWDVDWQLFYRFTQPIAFEVDDRIRISCSYDTRPRDEPVSWGLGTEDEMCIGYTFLTE